MWLKKFELNLARVFAGLRKLILSDLNALRDQLVVELVDSNWSEYQVEDERAEVFVEP